MEKRSGLTQIMKSVVWLAYLTLLTMMCLLCYDGTQRQPLQHETLQAYNLTESNTKSGSKCPEAIIIFNE